MRKSERLFTDYIQLNAYFSRADNSLPPRVSLRVDMSQNEFHVTGQRSYQNDPELFNTLRKHTISHLTMVLGRVLGKADDWLFDLAQKEEVLIGSPHMDSMRKLRMAPHAARKWLQAPFRFRF